MFNLFLAVSPEIFIINATFILLIHGVVFSTSKKDDYPPLVSNVGWLGLLSVANLVCLGSADQITFFLGARALSLFLPIPLRPLARCVLCLSGQESPPGGSESGSLTSSAWWERIYSDSSAPNQGEATSNKPTGEQAGPSHQGDNPADPEDNDGPRAAQPVLPPVPTVEEVKARMRDFFDRYRQKQRIRDSFLENAAREIKLSQASAAKRRAIVQLMGDILENPRTISQGAIDGVFVSTAQDAQAEFYFRLDRWAGEHEQ